MKLVLGVVLMLGVEEKPRTATRNRFQASWRHDAA
jgi:hypothetical protein